MSELHPLPIGTDRITTGEEIVICAPFDGRSSGGSRRRDRTRSMPRSRQPGLR